MRKALHIAVLPVSWVVDKLHPKKFHPKKKKHAHVAVGSVLIITGSFMATHPVTWLPHFVWDALAYGIHGYGLLPILKVVREKGYDIERVDDDETTS